MIIQPSFYLKWWPGREFRRKLANLKTFKTFENCRHFQLAMSSAFSNQNPCRILMPYNFFQLTRCFLLTNFHCDQKADGSGILPKTLALPIVKKRWLSLNPISYCLENKCIFILPRRALGTMIMCNFDTAYAQRQ